MLPSDLYFPLEILPRVIAPHPPFPPPRPGRDLFSVLLVCYWIFLWPGTAGRGGRGPAKHSLLPPMRFGISSYVWQFCGSSAWLVCIVPGSIPGAVKGRVQFSVFSQHSTSCFRARALYPLSADAWFVMLSGGGVDTSWTPLVSWIELWVWWVM